MSRLWILLLFLIAWAPGKASDAALNECRKELRQEVFDPYLLSACEVFISGIEQADQDQRERMTRLVAASSVVRSNVSRCQRAYSTGWQETWGKIKPSLTVAYDHALHDLTSMTSMPSGEKWLQSVRDDMSWLELTPVLTAANGK